LLEPDQMVGSDQWFDYAMEKLMAQDKVSEDVAEARVEAIWNRLQSLTRVHPVEADTPAVIAALQKKGVKTMALTARPVAITDVTLGQIAGLGIDFKASRPAALDFAMHPRGDLKKPANYRDGVLFANGNDKGKLLVAFLARVGMKPDAVIFVDDKKRNVANVERALVAAKIPHVAWRYGGADPSVKRFDGPTADVQYFHLQRILSDADAAALVRALPVPERSRFGRLEPLK
jgi:phosphoglycolate phosphatase-like HAD superfamily hydrolase